MARQFQKGLESNWPAHCEGPISANMAVACRDLATAQEAFKFRLAACSRDPAAPQCTVFEISQMRAMTRANLIDTMNLHEKESYTPQPGTVLQGPAVSDRYTSFYGDVDDRAFFFDGPTAAITAGAIGLLLLATVAVVLLTGYRLRRYR